MNKPDDQDPFAYDERLRAHFAEAARTPPPPPARIWQNLQPHLQPRPVPPAPRRAPWLAGFAGLLVGMLLMWVFQKPNPRATTAPAPTQPVQVAPPKASQLGSNPNQLGSNPNQLSKKGSAFGSEAKSAPFSGNSAPFSENSLPFSGNSLPSSGNPLPFSGNSLPSSGSSAPFFGNSLSSSGNSLPSSGSELGSDPNSVPPTDSVLASNPGTPGIPAVLLPLITTEQAMVRFGTDSALTTRERRRDALLMQRAALVRLQLRTDSLLRALAPTVETGAVAAVDSTPVVAKPQNRWSVLLTAAAERNFFGLNAPATDTLAALRRTHEQGRAGYNAALLAEYRLTNRWSFGAGLGTSAYGAELRLTDRKTQLLRTDTTVALVQNTRDTSITTPSWSIRVVDELRLSPVVNFNNQIIGYDSVYVQRNDTVWTYLTTVTSVTTTDRQYTLKRITRDEVTSRVLRPSYRFLTLPVFVRYRLGRAEDWGSSPTAPRWWADVSVGAQLQWFMGGTQLVSSPDGRTYSTARIGRTSGPFRPFNYALLSSVAVNYALTPRLSASLAPSVRYQVQSIYQPATRLTQRPLATGVQLGLRYAF